MTPSVRLAPAIGAFLDLSATETVTGRPASVGGGKVKLRSGVMVALAGTPEPRFTWVVSRPPIGEGQGEGAVRGAEDGVGDGSGEISGAGWVNTSGFSDG